MGERSYVTAEGMVHLVNPAMGSEFTLCGDAFDLASDIPGYEWSEVRRGPVSCPRCARIIEACRGVRTAAPQP